MASNAVPPAWEQVHRSCGGEWDAGSVEGMGTDIDPASPDEEAFALRLLRLRLAEAATERGQSLFDRRPAMPRPSTS